MKLPFLDRDNELARLQRLLGRSEGTFGALYGRRRCGKSRLLREVLTQTHSVYYVGDDREAALQRAGLAKEIAYVLEGFDQVIYPDWDALLARWWAEAPSGAVLILDELPAMVASAPELPSLLQKRIDHQAERGLHLIVAGSSQQMMQGLVLDRSAPLYGRATEILKIGPLPPGWIKDALSIIDPVQAIAAYSVWGGVPRYWELAADHPNLAAAIASLALDPLGVLHEEPGRLLRDDMRDTTQAASILSLIGRGCHRVFEIAGRLGKPTTSLSRPLGRLMEMGLVARDLPFDTSARSGKRTLYRIDDPFLRFWFRFVEPNRSRLETGYLEAVERSIQDNLKHHVGSVWEDLARDSVPALGVGTTESWGPASRWWGTGLDRKPLEVDVVAESISGDRLLVGEAKWITPRAARQVLIELERKIERLPFVNQREVVPILWLAAAPQDLPSHYVVTPQQVLAALR